MRDLAEEALRRWPPRIRTTSTTPTTAAWPGADSTLLARAAAVAQEHGISVDDAAYAAAADRAGGKLVSCDLRDLVSRGRARLPGEASADGHP